MLDSKRKGYAVMSKDLSGISLEDENLETCKRYCGVGDVICERIPRHFGYEIRFYWSGWWKPVYFRFKPYNILWLHFSINKIYTHKTGNIVWTLKF